MDLGIVLDASGSIQPYDYRLQLQFTKDLLHQVNIGPNKTRAGIINYSGSTQILTWLNTSYNLNDTLRQRNNATYFPDNTNTARALKEADSVFSYKHGRRSSEEGVTSVILVITDGASDNQTATIRAAEIIKHSHIIIVSVGIGNGPNVAELHAVCSPPAK